MNIKYIIFFLILVLAVISCKEKEVKPEPPNPNEGFGTGVLQEEELASLAGIPKDLSIVTLEEVGELNNSSKILLNDYVPPILSQGNYGTCTAWASGYYARTIMYAREHNLTPTDLQDKDNVFSPKDLFLAMRQKYGGSDCNGSIPYRAFTVMQERGIATLTTVPYEELGYCTQGTNTTSDIDAIDYVIENYRIAEYDNIDALKTYLAMGRPVQISCKLGSDFFGINNNDVFYGDDYSSYTGYHAMCLVGYDDDKGNNGAFEIVNSWGTSWGAQGYCWVDYNFFVNQFCYSAYVIEGDKGGLSEGMVDNEIINPNFQVDGKDFITVRFQDDMTDGVNRKLIYNVFNKGNEEIAASEDWNIIYYYYNAYDPENDFGILIYDYYTDDVGEEYQGQNGDFADISSDMHEYGAFNWWNYVDVPAGYSVAKAVSGDPNYDYDFEFDYVMPEITGEYYLVLMADGFNSLEEQYEQNNFIFFTGEDKAPLHIENGIIQESKGENIVHCGKLKQDNPNAYQIDEIASLIKFQKRSGKLQAKAQQLKSLRKGENQKRLIKAVLPREM